MSTIYLVVIGVGVILAGVLVAGLSLIWFRSDEVSDRIQEFVTEDVSTTSFGDRQRAAAIRFDVVGTLAERTLLRWFKSIGQYLIRFTPVYMVSNLERRLMLAGNPVNLGVGTFFGLRLVFGLAGAGIAFVVLRANSTPLYIALAILVFFLILFIPPIWLNSRIRNRQKELKRGLPDAIDMLSVCTQAGLGFDQSMQRVSDYWQTQIGRELGRVVSEMEVGFSRREAMKNMADRFNITELSSFVTIIIQAEQLGMSIADTLHAQAGQMREERRFRAQEEARKIPIKMLLPLAFLIFPAMIAVILGPSVPQLVELFTSF